MTGHGVGRKLYKTYKRAVVGFVDQFAYPLRLEDMGEEEKAGREKCIEEWFGVKDTGSFG
jgi:hypothetical protein